MISEDLTIMNDTTFRCYWPLFEADGITPLDVTGWQVKAEVREPTTGKLLATFDSSLSTGQVDVHLGPKVRAWKSAIYDVRLTAPTGDVIRPIRGKITNIPTVTR